MSKLKSIQQNASLRFLKICLSCFGIAGTTVFASGILKLSVLNNDRKIDRAFQILHPVTKSMQQIVERALY